MVVEEAVEFITARGDHQIKGVWNEKLEVLRARADPLRPELVAIRQKLGEGRYCAGARLHIPLLIGLMDECELGESSARAVFQ